MTRGSAGFDGAWRRARSKLLGLEALRDALGDELAERDGRARYGRQRYCRNRSRKASQRKVGADTKVRRQSRLGSRGRR